MWYKSLLFFREFSSVIPFYGMALRFYSNQGEGAHFYVYPRRLTLGRRNFFFQLKAKYPVFHFLDLDGKILNLI